MKILIVEDNPNWALKLEIMIADLGHELVGVADSVQMAAEILQKEVIDIVVCDIVMHEENSIDLFQSHLITNLSVIFVSVYADEMYYDRIKTIPNAHLLIKPFHPLTLRSIIDSTVPKPIIPIAKPSLTVRGSQGQKISITLDLIYWVSVEKNYCFVITENKKYAMKISLAKLMQQLDSSFVRVHKSYCVNGILMSRIDLNTKRVFIKNQTLPIGNLYRKNLLEYISKN